MADLVTRLLLNNTQFDNNIRHSTQQIQEFLQMGRNVASAVTKFAGAIGMATTATELFNRYINATQSESDKFNNTIGAAKATVDQFFVSLNTGDFSAFEGGLTRIFNKMIEIQELRDSLGDAKLSVGYLDKKTEADFKKYESIYRDMSKPFKERKAALESAKAMINSYGKELAETIKGNQDVILKELSAEKPNMKWSLSDIDLYLSYGNNDFSLHPLARKFQDYKNTISELKSKQYSTTTFNTSIGSQNITTENKEITKQIEELQKLNPLLDKWLYLNNLSDERRKKLLEDMEYDFAQKGRLSELQSRLLEGNNTIASASKVTSKASTSKAEIHIPVDFIPMGLEFEETTLAQLEADKKTIIKLMNNANQADYVKLKAKLELKEDEIALFKSGGFHRGDNPLNIPILHSSQLDSKKAKDNYNYADSLNAVAASLSNVSLLTNEGASAWLTYGANILTTVAAAIPAIAALTAAKKVETNANVENAVTGAAASQASIPFVGPLLAVAAVASVLAALAAIPKFATGGIIAGNSTFGDMNLARVNSGEMILNNHQQRNLFSLLNNGGAASNGGGKVEFKINGRELVGVLKNYNNKISKVQ